MITIPVWAMIVIIVVLCVLVAIAGWAAGMASRLNRLHIRTDSARVNLEGALRARAAAVYALQPSAGAEVAAAGRLPLRATDMGARSAAENKLLAALDPAVLSHPAVVETSTRVDLAARFYNDAVADTLAVRTRPAVRGLRLAGRAPLPEFYEAMQAGDVI
ncbi:MAG TPA: hypothetical protein H9867_05510 [Candidatus Corynebacterium gallistercoris]|uniref:NUDIX hydrolase n=1 Tax=Candidatus Corynebacterium gallistercoris TaxID=2838530 RepID=A0A9D1RY64_9CORY|nr:hypothetical protein [Candidatus Corynebacterium gallistercoris]